MQPKWPKRIPALSEDQQRISDDFMKFWHQTLPRYKALEKFNHDWVARTGGVFTRTLEIGAGLGEHMMYERLSENQTHGYVALELRQNMADAIKRRFPDIQVVVGDCQETIGFEDGHFDRIIAIHVLEHLQNLPATVGEMYRVLNKERGILQVVIPCEGGMAYSLCRRISAQRIFEKRYHQPYRWFIEREHINLPSEILHELNTCFAVERRSFFPLRCVPMLWCNLCIAMNLKPQPDHAISQP